VKFLAGLLGMPIWIIWFRISPVSLGRSALDGFLRAHGIAKTLLPIEAKNEIVINAQKVSYFMNMKKGTLAQLSAFSDGLEFEALLIRYVLLEPNRSDSMLRNADRLVAILNKHGIKTPPINI
jgi:hypothetical protein